MLSRNPKIEAHMRKIKRNIANRERRERFAVAAMVAIISKNLIPEDKVYDEDYKASFRKEIALAAVEHADALMEALDGEE